MKNILLKTICTVAAFTSLSVMANISVPVDNAVNQQGGYYNPAQPNGPMTGQMGLNSVASIQNSKSYLDDVPATLTGKITKQVGYEHYEFSDGTGTMVVEIEAEDMWGLTITPDTQVTIFAEVENEGYGPKVEAKAVRAI